MKNISVLGLLILVMSQLTGCASPANIEKMAIDQSDANKLTGDSAFKSKVNVGKVSGGEETNPLWTSEISGPDFKKALIQSLSRVKMLSGEQGEAKYILEANLLNVEQPMFGLDFTVTTTVQYVLTEKESGKEIFSRKIVAPYTATFSDAFVGMTRLKLANEGSARTNITQVINDLHNQGVDIAKVELKKKRIAAFDKNIKSAIKVNRYYRIKNDATAMYWEPTTTSEKVMKLQRSDLVYATYKTKGGWYLISEEGKNYGWLYKSELRHDKSMTAKNARYELAVKKRMQQYKQAQLAEATRQKARAAQVMKTAVQGQQQKSAGSSLADCATYLAKKKACDKLGYFGSMACMMAVSKPSEKCF